MLRKLSAVLLLAALPAQAQQVTDAIDPEIAASGATFGELTEASDASLSAKAAGTPVDAEDWMIVAAHPLAVEAGARVLRDGGSAADAMVAVQAVLGLVEPQSSGLGGGAFLVWYDAKSGELTTLDGRETAPLDATPTLFQTAEGETMGFFDAVVGGRSVGTPGTPALMEEAHRKWGNQPWAGLFSEAISLAETGFTVSARLAESVAGDTERLTRFPATSAYFFPEGTAIQAGDTLVNPEYAATARAIAAHGAKAFYTGPIADDIVSTVRTAAGNPGVLSAIDLAIYHVKERPAACAAYRGRDVCGMGPPSSGALTVGQILGMLDAYDLASMEPDSAEAWRLIGDASRLAFADRGLYMADSDFVPVPAAGLVDPAYLASRAQLLSGDRALSEVSAGQPKWDHAAVDYAPDTSIEIPSTSHISIVDAEGNALSMTTTIEGAFGSKLFVRGFLLNNELTDFSFSTHDDGRPIANRLEPGKRPRSSMAPTIVLDDGKPVLVVGSPGGSRIIGYVAKTIIAHLDWGMDVQQAVGLPNLVNRFGTFDVEAGTDAGALVEPLSTLGFKVEERDLTSGLHAIALGATLQGGADPRREGIALGE
ncbi:gamma-glutamyltransferase [Oceanicola sp. 22II-s10i]|uniref:gamma-glutamyltransferase n=1 Tax=Oceanicola sp. 22II-s10i TaxID=1317116 RepID=UPI000B51F3EE|nr:gamma-glutamyltransferase [Oceanicola sp. 22II-s10i]OWU83118.1 gamma-glutamyltransferase [Oceanicola sp. 22II-s10i]